MSGKPPTGPPDIQEPAAPPVRSGVGTLGATAAGLAAVAAIGQAFVVLREVYAAAEAGTSVEIDALLVALVVPSIAVSLLSSSTQAALVPTLIAVQAREGTQAVRRLAGMILLAVAAGAALVAVLIGIFVVGSIALAGPGLSPSARATAESFVPLLLPMVVAAPAGTLLAAVCQVRGQFRVVAASWIGGPVVALVVTISMWPSLGVRALAIATTADAVATVAVLVAGLALAGALPWPGRGVHRGDVVGFLRHMAPLAAGSSVLQLNLVADRAVASLLSTGAVAALRYGERIVRTPISIFLPAWSTTVYPTIARTVVGHDQTALGRASSDALRYVIAVFMPISVLTAAAAPVIVAFAYQRGAFDAAATATTAGVLAGFAPLILLWLVHPILNSAHNARRRGGLLARNAVLNAIFNLVLNLAFGLTFGVAGIALSTSVTGWLLVAQLGRKLAQLEPEFDGRPVLRVLGLSMLASVVPAVPIAAIAWIVRPALDLVSGFVVLGTFGLATAVAYLLVARAVGLREPWDTVDGLVHVVRRRLQRLPSPPDQTGSAR